MEYLMSALGIFHKGGVVMYVLVLCSVVVVTIAIERSAYFHKVDAGRDFAEKFYNLLKMNQTAKAMELVKATPGDLPELILSAHALELEKISTYFEMQSGIILAKMRKYLYYLSVIVTMAPLLGLLGTISGMISSFSVFNLDAGQAGAITGGVGEALIATAMGLCVAIMSLAVHAYFSQRIDAILTDMEQCFSIAELHPNVFTEDVETAEGVSCHEIA
jgi:biopolymer transport protein ExbB